MQSDSIVIAFDVAEDFRSDILDRCKDAVFNQFCFESRKETLGLRVVIAVSFATHTLTKPARVEQSAIFDRRVLAALVGMDNRVPPYQTAAPGLQKNVDDKLRRHPLGDFPSDNAARVFVLKES